MPLVPAVARKTDFDSCKFGKFEWRRVDVCTCSDVGGVILFNILDLGVCLGFSGR